MELPGDQEASSTSSTVSNPQFSSNCEESVVASFGGGLTVYVAFLCVGVGCGWFPVDALINLILNEPAFGPEWFGTITMTIGVVGIVQSAVFIAYKVMRRGTPMSLRAEQCRVMVIIVMTSVVLFVLSVFWSVGAPDFPVLIGGTVLAVLVVDCTYFFIFPFVAVHYGGWLVAPIRTGTDLCSLVTALLGESQNPSASHVLFPSSVLLQAYGAMSFLGVVAWAAIVRFGVGLREEPAKCLGSGAGAEAARDIEAPGDVAPSSVLQQLKAALGGFACPRALLWPVVVGTVVDVLQWGVVAAVGDVGAEMTDPEGCGAARGRWVARTSFTGNRLAVPLGGFASTLLPCSRRVFGVLAAVQVLSAMAMLSACLGLFRGAWTTVEGQMMYITCYALTGGLEGYLLTMSYRYIGDMPGLSESLRHSASTLLSLINVIGVDAAALVTGALVNDRVIRCTSP